MNKIYTSCKKDFSCLKMLKAKFTFALFVLISALNVAQAQAPTIVETPEDISYETYGVGMTALMDWVNANGGAIIEPDEDCGPAEWTNDFNMNEFEPTCGFYTGSIDVTFTYTDACENTISYTRTATLYDDTPPSCVKPYDLTIDCSHPNFDNVIAAYVVYWGPVTDLNHPITIESSYDENNFDENGQQVIVWTFTDACGNSRQWDATLTITGDCDSELTPSVINYELSCDEDLPAEGTGVTGTTTCPDGEVTVVLDNEETTQGDCAGDYTITRTYTVSDNCNNSETVTQTITVEDNTAPVFTYIPEDADVNCTAYPDGFGTPEVSDNCSDVTLTHTDTENPYTCDADFDIIRTWTATDECGNTTTASQTITIWPDNEPPVFTYFPSDYTVTCGEDVIFGEPTVEDQCSTFTLTSEITATGACLDGYTTTQTWTAIDACGNASSQTQTITVLPEPVPPVISVTPPTNFTLSCDEETPAAGITATTTCPDGIVNIATEETVETGDCPGNRTITRTYTITDNCGNSETAVQTITYMDTTPPVFSYVPGHQDLGCNAYPDGFGEPGLGDACGDYTLTYEDILNPYVCDADFDITRVWTATDECGNVATASQTITIWPDVEAPSFTFLPSDFTINCGEDVVFGEPTIVDDCTELTITSEVTATGECPDGYTTTKTWTATDACGNTTIESQTITVLAAPVLEFSSIPAERWVACGTDYAFDEPTCSSNCDAGYTLEVEDIIEEGICSNHQIITRRWTATDACGNAAIAIQTMNIIDEIAPNFTSTPKDKTVFCNDDIVFGTPVVADLCGSVELTFEDEIFYNNCEGAAASHVRTWIASDDCGNVATFENTIHVAQDTEAPVISALANKYAVCGDALEFDTPDATDDCQLELTYNDEIIFDGCEVINVRQWTAVDGCGNTATTEQSIFTTDEAAPTFNIESQQLIMTEAQYNNWTVPTVEAYDECTNANLEGPFIYGTGTNNITYTWVALDECANKASVTIKVRTSVVTTNPGTVDIVSNGFSVFPNPTTDETVVSFKSKTTGNATITITDLTGQAVEVMNTNVVKGLNATKVNVRDLNAGAYFITVVNGTEVSTQRVIKVQ